MRNLSRYEKIPTGLAVKLQFRKRAQRFVTLLPSEIYN